MIKLLIAYVFTLVLSWIFDYTARPSSESKLSIVLSEMDSNLSCTLGMRLVFSNFVGDDLPFELHIRYEISYQFCLLSFSSAWRMLAHQVWDYYQMVFWPFSFSNSWTILLWICLAVTYTHTHTCTCVCICVSMCMYTFLFHLSESMMHTVNLQLRNRT